MSTNVNFYQAVNTEDAVTIFVPPEEFEAHELGATYDAELYTTDQVLVIRIRSPQGDYMATNVEHRDAIASGKPVWVAHLHPTLGYVLNQCRLNFTVIG